MKFVLKKTRSLPGDQRGRFASIDPGIGGTGWAIWERSDFGSLVPPISSGSETAPINLDWPRAILEIAYRMGNIFRTQGVREVYIELPQLMQSATGQVAAASGALVKLSMAAGAIIGTLQPGICVPIPVGIPEWKGQLPKEEIARRVKARLPTYPFSGYGFRPTTTHEMDAVGIGLWAKGFL